MTKQISIISILALFLFFASSILATKVRAETSSADYEEVSYDDLINRLHKKKTRVISNQVSVLDDIAIHAGVGFITSAISVQQNNHLSQLNLNGFQISLGIDLFSPNWVAEGAIRNFGSGSNNPAENHSFREVDLKTFYRSLSTPSIMGYRLGAGLGTQYLDYRDPGISTSESSPALVVFGALDNNLSKNFGVGAELGYRTSMLSSNANRSSIDLMLRLDTYF
jgi:hypothetical protein